MLATVASDEWPAAAAAARHVPQSGRYVKQAVYGCVNTTFDSIAQGGTQMSVDVPAGFFVHDAPRRIQAWP